MISFFRKFSLRNKLLCILLTVMVVFSGFSLLLIQSIEEVSTVTNSIKDENIPEIVWLNQWEKELEIKKQIVLSNSHTDFEHDFQQKFEENDIRTSSMELRDEIPIPESIENIHKQLMLLDFTVTNKVFGLLEYNEVEAARKVIESEYLPILESLKDTVVTQRNDEYNSLQQNTSTYPKIIEKSLYFLLIITIVAILISIYFSFKMSKSITKPIESMVTKVNKIANGNYGEKVSHNTQPELQSLAKSINQMSISLQQSFQQIISDKMKHEQILNSLPVGIITYDKTEKEFLANSYVRSLFELSNESITDSDIMEKQNKYPILKMLISNESFQNKKIKITIHNKEYVLLVSQSKLKDYQQVTTGKILFFIDVTESTKLENRMIQSEKLALVGEMAASSAHEIRNPLTVIHGFLTLMKESMPTEKLEKYNFHLMMKEIDRLYSIVEQMLLMSNHKKPEKDMVLLRNMLEDLLPLMYSSLEAKNINVVTDITDEYILADQKQLKQVFLNLLRNSKDAIGDDGSIKIEGRVENNKYNIYFSDTGLGIPDSIKNVLFEPFSTSKSNGTGLGLNVVCRIIKNHQGEITVVSSDSSGTTFKITLPIIKNKSSDN
ncbi:two-component system, NtrC family, sensor histidine kinase AtoS [Gracilibacillus orientalis]|uniref:histidine kinase n=1 Tax=Gracilibacillus orientalis TaxID=334253 RepID=A0A1I4KY58_9BACI|nr:ATP-binding protein [Gracilibacillus orientalis]SFL83591.1 two-component system, NtrC family, sensor histidine kinase AtoS [Gracilibacillus orientalis]